MNVNITYDDMMLPIQGPENPYGDRGRFVNQNALAGHVEEQSMSDYAFRQQHMTHSIFGYSANPSVDPNAPTIVGSVEAAEVNGFVTLGSIKTSRSEKRAMKRKRKAAGNVEVADGDDAYVGPWGSWEGDDAKETPVGAGGESEESEEESEEEQVVRKKGKPKRGAPGQEHSVFHGKSMTDYQGRTYMHPPIVEAPQLQSESGSQESFLPKVCVHTWTGHTQGVSVIRVLPNTGHLFLSGSMDTKIKVSLAC
jgi:pre-mRNA-processing factor 17